MTSNPPKLRVGIVGAGMMGFWHARYLLAAGGVVAAVADRNLSVARSLATRFAGAAIFSGPDQMLREVGLDVMHLCTSPASHEELAGLALTRGVHVLVEKPMTTSVGAALRLYEIVERQNVLMCPVHQFLFQRGVQQARRGLGRIGELLHWEATFCSAGAELQAGRGPNEVLVDILPHPLSLLEYFFPGSLLEGEWSATLLRDGELRAECLFRGVPCTILVSMAGRPTRCGLRLLGSKGTLHVDLFHGFCVVEAGKVSKQRKITHPFRFSAQTLLAASANLTHRLCSWEPAYPGLRGLICAFYRAILTGAEPPIDREQSLAVLRARDTLMNATTERRLFDARI
jgi:predicted dehydrogenase